MQKALTLQRTSMEYLTVCILTTKPLCFVVFLKGRSCEEGRKEEKMHVFNAGMKDTEVLEETALMLCGNVYGMKA